LLDSLLQEIRNKKGRCALNCTDNFMKAKKADGEVLSTRHSFSFCSGGLSKAKIVILLHSLVNVKDVGSLLLDGGTLISKEKQYGTFIWANMGPSYHAPASVGAGGLSAS